MCKLKDFDHLVLDKVHAGILRAELNVWHKNYLPVGQTVLDIGAGNGETAQFYLNHGAKHVICIEPNAELLYRNFGNDKRVTIVPRAVNKIKSDCEGGEANMVIETHFPFYIKSLGNSRIVNPFTNLWKIDTDREAAILTNLRLLRIQTVHWFTQTYEYIFGRPVENGS